MEEILPDENESEGVKKRNCKMVVLYLVFSVIVLLAISAMGYLLFSQNKKLRKISNKIKIENKKTILLITNAFSKAIYCNETQAHYSPMTLYELFSNNSLFDLEVISPKEKSLFSDGFLQNYDCLVFDLSEYGYCYNDTELKTFINYAKNGGSILATHDHFERHSTFESTPEIFELFGLEHYHNKSTEIISGEVVINSEEITHPIFSTVYTLSERINILDTHRSCSGFTKRKFPYAKCLLSSNGIDYMVINKSDKGKTALIRAGHSTLKNEYPFLSEDERKLFFNTVYWLLYNDY